MLTNKINYQILADQILNGNIVLTNDLFDYLINNGYEFELVNGDFYNKIYDYDQLVSEIGDDTDFLEEITDYLETYSCFDPATESLKENFDEYIEEINEFLKDNDYLSETEFYQYYTVSPNAVDNLEALTDETVFYFEKADVYIWAVSHFGTAWDIVPLTIDEKIWIDEKYINNSSYKILYPSLYEQFQKELKDSAK